MGVIPIQSGAIAHRKGVVETSRPAVASVFTVAIVGSVDSQAMPMQDRWLGEFVAQRNFDGCAPLPDQRPIEVFASLDARATRARASRCA
jgi:hypothetical protein